MIQREYSDVAPWNLSHALRRSLLSVPENQEVGLGKEFQLVRQDVLPIIVASDGRADSSELPSVAVGFLDPISGKRVGAYTSVTQEPLVIWATWSSQ